jgi:hypothetical protein
MVKKQVHTMATAEKAASGSDWQIPLWTADGEVWLQGKSKRQRRSHLRVVDTAPFLKFFPCNHIINIKKKNFFFRRSKRQRSF